VLYGRDAERAEIAALLEAARDSRSGVLVLRGEPGIGKTALLEDTRQRAHDMHVLSARGLESESELPFAGLHQLIRPALHLLERLPAPQCAALQGALGLASRPGNDRFLISVACLTLLSELAERRPVLCLVDDVQWLDTPSTDALLFVARRLKAEAIVMLFAAREADGGRFEARALRDLELRGLDPESAASLIAGGVGGDIAPSVRELLVEQAGGNALALVELPAAFTTAQLAGQQPLPETLPLTPDVERLFLERVRRLPDSTQELLLIVAADDTGRLGTVMRAAQGLGIAAEALARAEDSGVVSVRGTSLELRHPLVRSAVYQGASSGQRRAVHVALADALADEQQADQRAWHRAAAALGPDGDVADELENTAERARLRSGHAAAAAALSRAAELSTDPELKARRLVGAARAAWHAGQPERASALLDEASQIASGERLRAELAFVRGEIQFQCGVLLDACETLMSGATELVEIDPRRALEMLFDAANAGENAGDYASVARAVQRAKALPRTADATDALLRDLLVGVGGLLGGTTPGEVPLMRDGIARADDLDEPIWILWAAFGASAIGDHAKGAELLRRAVALARTSGAVDLLTRALLVVAVEGIFEGRFAVGAEAAEGLRLAREAGLRNTTSAFHAILAWLAAVRGEEGECRMHAAEATGEARATGMALANSIAEWALSLIDLASGRVDETAARLEAVRSGPPGIGHPYISLMLVPDLVEACVRAGRDKQARTALAALESFANPQAPAWSLALVARCRALLSHGDDSERAFLDALKLHTQSIRGFDRARSELLYGEFLRRERRRTDAREPLRAALNGFEHLGAQPWAERARTELRASGETARKRDPSTIDQLTPQERQIARLVAEGLSNKEVAAQLFLSPRTIDYHLRNVFAKLGITSRTQLARLPLRREEEIAERSIALA
jgi:DNA-binding CsgD family transcriptional regulator